MSGASLHDVLTRSLRGHFTVPAAISPTHADIQLYEERSRVYRSPKPHPGYQGKAGRCWQNAAEALWQDRSLFYVQGLVQGRGSELIPHAWCTDGDGRLIEVTWDIKNATGAEVYVGVAFSLDELLRLQLHFGRYGWYDGFAEALVGVPA